MFYILAGGIAIMLYRTPSDVNNAMAYRTPSNVNNVNNVNDASELKDVNNVNVINNSSAFGTSQ